MLSFIVRPKLVYAEAANLYLSPARGSYGMAEVFSTGVYVSSPAQSSNAVSRTITFPSNLLNVVSISKVGSVVNLWVSEPAFSHESGTIFFQGIILNPGYQGAEGKIFTINFKAIAAGNPVVSFANGSILANDGQGTNILSGFGSANYTVTTGQSTIVWPLQIHRASSKALEAPNVSSLTHADSDRPYNDPNPIFRWGLPKAIHAIRIGMDKNPKAIPNKQISGSLGTYQFKEVADGIWYFHIRFKNDAGWGPVAHFKFQIDTVPPHGLRVDLITAPSEKVQKFRISAYDPAGMDHFEIVIDGNQPQFWIDSDGSGFFEETLEAGSHVMNVKGFDRAGNFAVKALEFNTGENLVPVAKAQRISETKNRALLSDPIVNTMKMILIGAALFGVAYMPGKKILKFIKINKSMWMHYHHLVGILKLLQQTAKIRNLTPEELKILTKVRSAILDERYMIDKEIAISVKGEFDRQYLATPDGKPYAASGNYVPKSKLLAGASSKLAVSKGGRQGRKTKRK